MSLVTEYLARVYGGAFEEFDSVLTAGVAETEAAPGDGERVVLGFVNLSVNTLFLATPRGASAARGIVLNASGGILVLNLIEDFSLVGTSWTMTASAAGSSVYRFVCRRHSRVSP